MKKVEVIINFMILLIIEKTKYDSIKSGDMALTFVKSELTKRKDNNLAVDLSLKLLYHLRELVEHEDTINTAHFLDRLQILLADHKNLFDIIVVQTSKTYSDESINYKKFELNNFIKLDKIIGLFKIESLRARNPTINFKEFVYYEKNDVFVPSADEYIVIFYSSRERDTMDKLANLDLHLPILAIDYYNRVRKNTKTTIFLRSGTNTSLKFIQRFNIYNSPSMFFIKRTKDSLYKQNSMIRKLDNLDELQEKNL